MSSTSMCAASFRDIDYQVRGDAEEVLSEMSDISVDIHYPPYYKENRAFFPSTPSDIVEDSRAFEFLAFNNVSPIPIHILPELEVPVKEQVDFVRENSEEQKNEQESSVQDHDSTIDYLRAIFQLQTQDKVQTLLQARELINAMLLQSLANQAIHEPLQEEPMPATKVYRSSPVDFEEVFDITPVPLALMKSDGSFISCNQEWSRMCGLSHVAISRQNIMSVSHGIDSLLKIYSALEKVNRLPKAQTTLTSLFKNFQSGDLFNVQLTMTTVYPRPYSATGGSSSRGSSATSMSGSDCSSLVNGLSALYTGDPKTSQSAHSFTTPELSPMPLLCTAYKVQSED